MRLLPGEENFQGVDMVLLMKVRAKNFPCPSVDSHYCSSFSDSPFVCDYRKIRKEEDCGSDGMN